MLGGCEITEAKEIGACEVIRAQELTHTHTHSIPSSGAEHSGKRGQQGRQEISNALPVAESYTQATTNITHPLFTQRYAHGATALH